MVDAPFKISDKCCKIMKKDPLLEFTKSRKKYPYIGIMASNSSQRQKQYLKTGCNAFDSRHPKSTPLGFWNEADIWEYIKTRNLNHCSIYDSFEGKIKSTGCMFCMFGVHLEKSPNRFERMKETHPLMYDYCINNFGCGKVLDYIGVRYGKI